MMSRRPNEEQQEPRAALAGQLRRDGLAEVEIRKLVSNFERIAAVQQSHREINAPYVRLGQPFPGFGLAPRSRMKEGSWLRWREAAT